MKIDIQYIDYTTHSGCTNPYTYNYTQKTNTQRVFTDSVSFSQECAEVTKFGFFLDANTFIPPSALLRITKIKD